MLYDNFSSQSQSMALTAAERSDEAKYLLARLRKEGDSRLEEKLTVQAYQFVQDKLSELELLEEMGSKADLAVSTSQLFWLRSLWDKFA